MSANQTEAIETAATSAAIEKVTEELELMASIETFFVIKSYRNHLILTIIIKDCQR